MSVTLVIGGQWGDEGKAKIIDYLAPDADYVVRYQGGANAGHTVVTDGKRFAFHLVPSGILYPRVTCVLGGGMVVDPVALEGEMEQLAQKGIDVSGRILISEQAHVVMPYHIVMDRGSEERLGSEAIGTTRKGISPAYMDKVGRDGMRMCDFLRSRADLEKFLAHLLRKQNKRLRQHGLSPIPITKTVDRMTALKKKLEPLITDTRPILWNAVENKKKILLEGAQGTMLDIDHGTYPYVTSSNPTAGGALIGTGLPASAIDRVVGIFKAYCTRVGNGPFPTEDTKKNGQRLRDVGNEYGTTTGRPRRCGWFDAVAARTAVKLNGVTQIALTKLDVLDDFDEIKVCTSYRCGGKRLDYFPTDVRVVERCRPHYELFEGWRQDTGSAHKSQLPAGAAAYVSYLEELVGCPIDLVSTGPERSAMVKRA